MCLQKTHLPFCSHACLLNEAEITYLVWANLVMIGCFLQKMYLKPHTYSFQLIFCAKAVSKHSLFLPTFEFLTFYQMWAL